MHPLHAVIPQFLSDAPDSTITRQFVVVFDGHSSHRGAEHASKRLHEFIAAQPAIQCAQVSAHAAAELPGCCLHRPRVGGM